MPTLCYGWPMNWKDTAYPNETREHWNMRKNRNYRKARRKFKNASN